MDENRSTNQQVVNCNFMQLSSDHLQTEFVTFNGITVPFLSSFMIFLHCFSLTEIYFHWTNGIYLRYYIICKNSIANA